MSCDNSGTSPAERDQPLTEKKPLVDRIMKFRKWRNWIAIPLILVGIVSLALPILPGIAILFLGILLINPGLAYKIKDKIMRLYNNIMK
ncbi:hypothetical protein AMJ80_06095 [bacterium SM23_31]|nr:MAG: hypothetical protein AMJ80_06095 [bacterium SM23_31]